MCTIWWNWKNLGYIILKNNLKIPLEYFYEWENNKPNDTFLVQPINGKYHYFTWKEVGDQARRVSNYINSLNLKPNSQIAIISKNCAHWICDIKLVAVLD